MPMGTTAIGGLVFNLLAAGSLAAGALVGQAGGAPSEPIQWGALSLCVFMVWQNYRVQDRMGRVIDSQHREFVKIAKDATEVITRNTAAMEACMDRRKAGGP